MGGRDGGARGVFVAVLSTLLVFGAIAVLVVRSSGWDAVKAGFFSGEELRASLPEIAHAFLLNVRVFLVVEAIVLVAALLLAVLRSLPGPVFFPLRLLAIVYADIFRAVPTILLVYLLGFGLPGLQISGLPTDEVFWAGTALALVYTAYVSEVYRAGIDSVHPSQDAAARSLGLSRLQSLRHVVLPQAVRRVVPPLLNDFIGLQKDTALIAPLGVVEALKQAQIDSAATFNYTPYVAAALLFLAVTIPLTRLTDWLLARDRRRRQASGALG
jgi:polar amino acid transport system permease protein